MQKFGLSGDKILFEGNFVTKICETNQERFLNNCIKQQDFDNLFIKSVPIIEQSITIDNKNFIKMPRLKCDNAIHWLSNSNIYDINSLINILLNYFSSIFISHNLDAFDANQWHNKINDLKSKIEDIHLLEILNILNEIKFKNQFYYGDYHGDLTFSNLFIFNSEKEITIDAIDFLHSFIKSPINDLVKIRQDTKHLWTFTLMEDYKDLDINKIMIILNFIDININNFISKDPILSEFYLPFQILNLMRIVPYNKEERIFCYLKIEIEELFNEFNAYHTHSR